MKTICALLCALFPALAHAAYTPSATETAVLTAILNDELSAFSEGGDTVIGAMLGLSLAPAQGVAATYANGPTAAFPATLQRPMLVSGGIASIQNSSGKKRIATFTVTGSVPVRAELPKDFAASKSLALVCGRMDLIAGTPTFSACEDSTVVGKQAVAKLKAQFASFYQGQPTEARVSQLAINVSLAASLLTAGHGCPGDIARCTQSIQATHESNQSKQALSDTVRRFQEAGLDLSPYAASNQRSQTAEKK
ncbi:hypothetical protein RAS12_07690 [Achromobacter seleniivolatilans]|uniref:Secreted protein n=1 Tax=Achromobacter seleniivolatilans TaxID=3047478 RepID=A0ABY9M5G9_9BURK|nr:hypothetical protein [Achromobacter sp. R39]WMD22252.1 hypothetical protein RAS12_07690 [Achromobacter sp. R39]